MHTQRAAKRAFTLIEILIVVVILGILAAIVIPQFTSAADDAQQSSVQSQLQTVRSQIELWNMRNPGTTFDGTSWDVLTEPDPNNNNSRYLQSEPRNAMRANAVGLTVGSLEPPAASGAAADVGWYWNNDMRILYAIDREGNLMEW